MGFWIFMYKKPEAHPRVNKVEFDYINQDSLTEEKDSNGNVKIAKKMPFLQAFKYRQTWAFAFGKFMTDGVWWFYLFWTPAYLSDVYGLTSDTTMAKTLIFVLYAIVMLSIIGGWLPKYFVEKKGMNPYAGRMRAMLIFAFFPLLALLAQPLGHLSYWFPIVIIGIAAAAHQAWSANIFSTIGDMFPKSAIATITGIGGMAGGLAGFIINKGSGALFDAAQTTNMKYFGFEGIQSGYFIIFSICAVAYLIGWIGMKILVPKYKPIVV
jgi:ACS family hexuronate transporter-like MFS transporter